MVDDGVHRPAWTFSDEDQLAAFVQKLVNEGCVVADIAGRIGFSATWVYRFARRRGIHLKAGKPQAQAPSEQAQAVLRDFDEHKEWSLDRIGQEHGLTSERVRQIAERWGRLSRREERSSELFDFRDLVRQALEGATSLQQVAERTGLTPAQVRKVAETALGVDAVQVTEDNRRLAHAEQLAQQSMRLRLAIEMAGLTHQQIASALGVAPARATNIINGKVGGVETFREPLARTCGVDPRWLLDGTRAPPWMRPDLTEEALQAERAAIAERLREALDRLPAPVPSTAIAAALGITPALLGQLASGRASPRRYLGRLAEVLHIPERWLRFGEGAVDWATWSASWPSTS